MFEIGNTLREARVRRNLTLQQVEEDTKIRVKYLQAMENEEWDVMPGSTYVKGFLRTYATYLGLDPDVIIDEYRSRAVSPVHERHEPFGGDSMLGKPRSHRGRNTVVFVAMMCLLILAIIYAVGMMEDGSGGPTTKPSALGISTSPSPRASKSPTPTKTVPAWQRDLIKVSAVSGDCWMKVRRDSEQGVVLFSGTVRKGQKKKFKGADIWITLESPGAVEIEAAGKEIAMKSDQGPWLVKFRNGQVSQSPSTQGL